MAIPNTVTCDVCGRARSETNHWRLVWLSAGQFVSSPWKDDLARFPGVKHVCGDAHATTLFNRYLMHGGLEERKTA